MVFLIAVHSVADMGAFERGPVAGADKPVATNNGAAPCWRDWPDVQSGCLAAKKPAALAAAVPAVRAAPEERAAPKVSAAPVEAPRPPENIRQSAAATTDGAGQREKTVPASTPQIATPVPAARPKLSERELTFKQGYALRQAALGGASTAVSAPVSQKVAEAKPKPRKQRAPVQVYQLPDGRTVVVRRQNGRSPLDVRTNPGGFRSAEMRPERFGQTYGRGDPYASRRGMFGGFY